MPLRPASLGPERGARSLQLAFASTLLLIAAPGSLMIGAKVNSMDVKGRIITECLMHRGAQW